MKIIEFDLKSIPENIPNLALCLGFFDGIHLGHKELIKQALSTSLDVGLLTFSTPPSYVIGRKDTTRSLTSIDDKAYFLELLGVKYLFVMPFDNLIKNLSCDDFIELVLKKMNPNKIFCGEDYRFGKNAYGDPTMLKEYFDTHVIPLVKIRENKFSSKIIRHLIYDGKIKEANELLGHYYRLGGLVVSGNQVGKGLGFPTANLELDFPYVIPNNGVYAGYAYVHEVKHPCLISVGTHPTLGALDVPIIEVYIFDFDHNIYGTFIFIEFVSKLRDMFKFNRIEDLIKQIKLDKLEAEKLLK